MLCVDCSKDLAHHKQLAVDRLLTECGQHKQFEHELLLLESVGIHILSILDDLALAGAKLNLALAISAS